MRARIPTALLFLLLLAPLPPAAAVEKCISPQGKVTYSEQACPPGYQSQTLRAPASGSSPSGAVSGGPASGNAPAQAAPAASGGSSKESAAPAAKAPLTKPAPGGVAPAGVKLSYYDVQGGDFDALLAALNAGGGFHGKAEWKLSYRYEPKKAGKACSVKSLDTQLELSMTMPRWNPPPGTAPSLYARWQRYVAALQKHEEGHLQIGRDLESSLRKSIAVVSERCPQLEARIKGIFELLLAQHRKRDEDYDRETAHGRTQGAEFR